VVANWRRRARAFKREAKESGSVRDIYRLAGMASSLDFAARELCHVPGIDPSDGLAVANTEADQARLESESQLARDAEKSEP
jgi:hypothetical protein